MEEIHSKKITQIYVVVDLTNCEGLCADLVSVLLYLTQNSKVLRQCTMSLVVSHLFCLLVPQLNRSLFGIRNAALRERLMQHHSSVVEL